MWVQGMRQSHIQVPNLKSVIQQINLTLFGRHRTYWNNNVHLYMSDTTTVSLMTMLLSSIGVWSLSGLILIEPSLFETPLLKRFCETRSGRFQDISDINWHPWKTPPLVWKCAVTRGFFFQRWKHPQIFFACGGLKKTHLDSIYDVYSCLLWF